jgi:hypothetical protein
VALSEDQQAMLRMLAQREQGYGDIAALSGQSVEQVRAKVKDALAGLDDGLSADQKALLRLQAQREDGYGDIAALSGQSVEQVRAKVKDAIAALDGEPATEPAGQVEARPAPEPVAEEAEPPKAAQKPESAPKPTRSAPKPPPKATAPKKATGLKLPEDKGALRALAAGAAVVVVIVLLLVTGVLGSSDDSGSSGSSGGEATSAGQTTGSAAQTASGKVPTEAVLSAVGGGSASGRALFGRSGKKVELLLSAKGLQPSPGGQSYIVSLISEKGEKAPLVATKTKTHVIAGRFQIPNKYLGLLAAGFDRMEISLVSDSAMRAAIAEAAKTKQTPTYPGTAVLSGPVTGPIVEAGSEG